MVKYKKCFVGCIVAGILLTAANEVTFAGEWHQEGINWKYSENTGNYVGSNVWKQIDGKWYCFEKNEYMATGWIYSNNKWYYCYTDGSMAENTWIEGTYYVGADGAMYTNKRTPDGYYVGSDGAWIKGATISEYSEAELLDIIRSVCNGSIGKGSFVADFNNDGKQEMIVQVFESDINGEYDPWTFCYWYTDGEHTYSFGEEDVTGTIYEAKFSLIPTSLGADLVINMGWRPLAFGGYMDSAYIYRITPDRATKMFSRDCCLLIESQYESIKAINYEPFPGMIDTTSIERLYIKRGIYQ